MKIFIKMQFSKAYFVMTYYPRVFLGGNWKENTDEERMRNSRIYPHKQVEFFLVKAKSSVSTKYLNP